MRCVADDLVAGQTSSNACRRVTSLATCASGCTLKLSNQLFKLERGVEVDHQSQAERTYSAYFHVSLVPVQSIRFPMLYNTDRMNW